MKICSACSLGIKCRYNGRSKANKNILKLAKKETLIPVCPEQLGGLPIPRGPYEIRENKVFSKNGEESTAAFLRGAREVLRIAKLLNCKEAIFKQRSPSCGCGEIYDGSFSGKVVAGDGITTKLLKEHGIKVFSEEDLS